MTDETDYYLHMYGGCVIDLDTGEVGPPPGHAWAGIDRSVEPPREWKHATAKETRAAVLAGIEADAAARASRGPSEPEVWLVHPENLRRLRRYLDEPEPVFGIDVASSPETDAALWYETVRPPVRADVGGPGWGPSVYETFMRECQREAVREVVLESGRRGGKAELRRALAADAVVDLVRGHFRTVASVSTDEIAEWDARPLYTGPEEPRPMAVYVGGPAPRRRWRRFR